MDNFKSRKRAKDATVKTSIYFKGEPSSDNNNDISPAKVTKTPTRDTEKLKASGDCDSSSAEKLWGSGLRLSEEFYNKECCDLAKALLGQLLVHVLEETGERLTGVIVETEAYCGVEDKAAHSYQGKRTGRTEAMFMKPGTAYVYSIYGMYCCMNISSLGEGCAVLLRAIQPKEGLDKIREIRTAGKKSPSKRQKDKDLGNGPSKLCMALGIKKEIINKQDLVSSKEIWVEKGDNVDDLKIVTSKRINISYGEDWVDKPLRFYVLDNNCVSVRDKEAEKIVTAATL